MAAEKQFENKVKGFLHDVGVYPAGCPKQKMTVSPTGWYLKTWGGGFQKSGIPDLLACINGFFVSVELKAENGAPSELQIKNTRLINWGNGVGLVLYPSGFESFKNLTRGLIGCNAHIAELNALKVVHTNTSCDTLTA